jgi:ligand-binding sensor domain-containing protein
MASFRVSLLTLISQFLLCIAVNAQPLLLPDLKFRTYNTLDGITDNSVVKVLQDKKGFLWIATHNGLSRFDGLHFKNYTYSPNDSGSLRSIWVTDMALDQNGIIWISTEWGICWYDEACDQFHYINRRQQVQILYKGPLCMGQNNTLWLAAEDGLIKIDATKKTFVPTVLNRLPNPQCIDIDSNGNIWIGTLGNGIYLYDNIQKYWEHFYPDCIPKEAHIMDMHREGDTIWMATSDGLLKVHTPSKNVSVNKRPTKGPWLNDNALMSVVNFPALHGDNMLLCGTYDKRLLLYNKKTELFVYQWQNNHIRLNDMPYGIYFDLFAIGKILWIGSDRGLSKLDMSQQDFTASTIPVFFNKSQNKTLIKHIIADKQHVTNFFIITAKPDSGLFSYNRTTGATKKISPYHYNSIYTDDKSGGIWACRKNAVEFFTNGKLTKQIKLPATPNSCFIDAKGKLWLATADGLAEVNIGTSDYHIYKAEFKGTSIENKSFEEAFFAMDMAMSANGNIWLASIKYGLFEFDTTTKKFIAHRQPFNTSYEAKNRCSSVEVDESGNIWVGNMAGLTMYNPKSNLFTNYNRDSGLLNTYVYSIKFDKNGLLWGRGNTNVFSFNRQQSTFSDYNLPQEMIPSFYGQRLSQDGLKMLLGFEGGYAHFNPIQPTPSNLKIYLNTCYILGKRYSANFEQKEASHVFKHNENVLSMSFTAVDYEQPEKVHYAYLLEGFDKDWQYSNKLNLASYTNLPPGNYKFWAKARQDNSAWVTIPQSFNFYIRPALWQRVWFWPLVLLMITTGLVAFFIKRVKDSERKMREKANISKLLTELEMKTLRTQMNPHFIFNSLNSVQKFIWENKKEDASDYLSKFAKLIRMILEHSSQSNILLMDDLGALKTYIELEHRRSNGRFEYVLKIENDVDATALLVPPLLLQPFVENAIWHGLGPLTERSGHLSILIKRDENWLICKITDNGIGRKKAAEIKAQSSLHRKSVGMEITRQRLSLSEKEGSDQIFIEIVDLFDQENPVGTEVTLRIPYVKNTSN